MSLPLGSSPEHQPRVWTANRDENPIFTYQRVVDSRWHEQVMSRDGIC